MQPYSHKDRHNQRQEEGQVIGDAKLAFLDMAPQCKDLLCPDFLSDKVGYNNFISLPWSVDVLPSPQLSPPSKRELENVKAVSCTRGWVGLLVIVGKHASCVYRGADGCFY